MPSQEIGFRNKISCRVEHRGEIREVNVGGWYRVEWWEVSERLGPWHQGILEGLLGKVLLRLDRKEERDELARGLALWRGKAPEEVSS